MGVGVQLGGVPETLLWTLRQRATEARRPDRVLDDPLAIALVDALDYPFAERFGSGEGFSQWQALRAGAFDAEVRRAEGAATVVALGEGLETTSWRVGDAAARRWVTVDVPETIALRRAALAAVGVEPEGGGRRLVAASAFDVDAWAGAVDGVPLITAQGLFMYFPRDEVFALLGSLAARFPGAKVVFDAVPRWLARRSARDGGLGRAERYRAPVWPWGLDAADLRALRALPAVAELAPVRPRRGRGVAHGVLLPALTRVEPVRRRLFSIWRVTLAGG